MLRSIRSRRIMKIPCGFAIATVLAATSASGQPVVAPTTRSYFSVTPVPFEEARLATEEAANAAVAGKNHVIVAADGTGAAAAPEIIELARALKNDPDLIYQYVHDNIEFSPLWGVLKGPVGTLLDGRGNSFDQAALMVALLNQASLANSSISNVVFEFGQLSLTSARLQSWLGVDSNPYSVGGILAQGGIPVTAFYTNGDATFGHVWVKVNINGTSFVFDPAFKSHNWKTGIVASLPSIMGYSQAQFLSDANASVTATSIQNVNRNNLRNDLASYAGQLATYIRNNLPTGGVSDVVGGGTITPAPFSNGQTVRQTTNPNQYGIPTDWTSIPSQYNATFSVTLPGAAAQTYNSTDVYGHRLSIFFNSSYVPTLYLDGAAVLSGSASSQGAQVGIAFSISIPWATWANQSRTQYISAQTNQNSGGYVVQTGWDQVGRGMIEKHRKLLSQAINSGAAANSEPVLGESLAVIGYTWLAECAAQQRLSDQFLGTTTQYFYGGGIVGQAVGTSITSPYVDLPLNFINTPARINGAATQTANSLAAFLDSSGTSSSFESTTLEQTQANVPGFVAASTVKLLDTGIQNGDTIFDINNGNTSASQQAYTNTIRPQLVLNYNAGDLATIDSYVAGGFRVIAPLHGKLPIGNWTGVGFKTLLATAGGDSYGEIISGGLSGAFGGVNDPSLVPNTDTSMPVTFGPYAPSGASTSANGTGGVGDPLDYLKGSYLYRHEDLTTGPKGFPFGLNLERSYDSGAQNTTGPFGAGWTHNYAVTASTGSDGFSGMGQSSPLSAVSSIVALYVSSDLVKGQALTGQANLELLSAYFVTYKFDPLNRMTEIDENGSAANPLAKYQWDLLSRLSLIAYGDGTTDSYSQYDAADNLQTLTQSFAGGQNDVTFTYGWLKNHQRQSTVVTNSAFQYAPLAGTISYAPADVNNGYTSAGGTTFTYDGNRNLAFDGFNTLAYDVENRLIKAQNAIRGEIQYLYDPLGQRKQKQADGVITQFVLVGSEEIADFNFTGAGAGTPQMLTVRGVGGLPVAAVSPAAGVQPETVEYYHHDVLGSSVAGTLAGQSGAFTYTYSEFGAPSAGDVLTYRFAGYRYDTETGLYYVRARHFSPVLGRFLQTDPVGIAGGANLYAYVNNDPLNLVDPFGLCLEDACIVEGVGTGAAYAAASALVAWGVCVQACGQIISSINQAVAELRNAVFMNPPGNAWDPNGPKAPGYPGDHPDYEDPKGGPNWVPNPNGSGYGWEDKSGKVWVPTGQGDLAHGGPHWDVENPKNPADYGNKFPPQQSSSFTAK
jgi:RHS repeat-associated protein